MKPAPARVEFLPVPSDLSETSIEHAISMVEREPSDGWADLVVHTSQLRPAMRLAAAHNKAEPKLQLRVLCETRLGMNDWKLKTRTVEVRSQW